MSLNKHTKMSLNFSFMTLFQGSQELSTQRYRKFATLKKLNFATRIITANLHTTSILNSNNNNQDKNKLETTLELRENIGESHLEHSPSPENYNPPQIITLLEYNSDTDVIPSNINNELHLDMELSDHQKFIRYCDLNKKKACTGRLTFEEEAELAIIYDDFILQGLYLSELQDPKFIHMLLRASALPTILEEEEEVFEDSDIESDDSGDDEGSDSGSSSGSSDFSDSSSSSESPSSSDSSGTIRNSKLASNYNNSYFIYFYNKFIGFLLEFIFTFLPIISNKLFFYFLSLFV